MALRPADALVVYSNIPHRPLEYASTILGCIAVVVTIPIYVFYRHGPAIRARSKFALSLDQRLEERREKRRASSVAVASGRGGMGVGVKGAVGGQAERRLKKQGEDEARHMGAIEA